MDFVILANAWSAVRDNPTSKHQIALELARQGHRVLWMEGAGMRRPRMGSARDRRRAAEKLTSAFRGPLSVAENLWKIAPLIVPLPASPVCRRFNEWLYGVIARRCASRLGFDTPALVSFLPTVPGLLAAWRGRTIYYCVDRWDSFGTYDHDLMASLDADCCRQADIVVASSADLYERCTLHNANTHLVTHGVDHEHFAQALRPDVPRPPDLPEGRLIGFFGLISEWVDQNLLVRLAREVPQAHLVLMGKADVPTERLAAEKNIHLLGPRSFEELPADVAHFDVGIIPFVVNDLTRAVNPIKLKEMLAAGCPVVSTALPEVEKCQVSGVRSASPCVRQPTGSAAEGPAFAVSIARDTDDFVRLVRYRIENPLAPAERQAVSESVRQETWEAKVSRLLELIEKHCPDHDR